MRPTPGAFATLFAQQRGLAWRGWPAAASPVGRWAVPTPLFPVAAARSPRVPPVCARPAPLVPPRGRRVLLWCPLRSSAAWRGVAGPQRPPPWGAGRCPPPCSPWRPRAALACLQCAHALRPWCPQGDAGCCCGAPYAAARPGVAWLARSGLLRGALGGAHPPLSRGYLHIDAQTLRFPGRVAICRGCQTRLYCVGNGPALFINGCVLTAGFGPQGGGEGRKAVVEGGCK